MTRREWPLLAVAALMLIVAAVKAISSEDTAPAAIAMGAAGLILVGAWLTLEILAWRRWGRDDGKE